jgi:hypothetical protein
VELLTLMKEEGDFPCSLYHNEHSDLDEERTQRFVSRVKYEASEYCKAAAAARRVRALAHTQGYPDRNSNILPGQSTNGAFFSRDDSDAASLIHGEEAQTDNEAPRISGNVSPALAASLTGETNVLTFTPIPHIASVAQSRESRSEREREQELRRRVQQAVLVPSRQTNSTNLFTALMEEQSLSINCQINARAQSYLEDQNQQSLATDELSVSLVRFKITEGNKRRRL